VLGGVEICAKTISLEDSRNYKYRLELSATCLRAYVLTMSALPFSSSAKTCDMYEEHNSPRLRCNSFDLCLIQIKQFYILDEWTGRKLGDVLMSRCHEHATTLGVESIWLSVWKNNDRAIHFYERWGFRNLGTCDFMVGNDIQKDFVLLTNIPGSRF
jgi:GNAT superfamily N-acetyltransferase